MCVCVCVGVCGCVSGGGTFEVKCVFQCTCVCVWSLTTWLYFCFHALNVYCPECPPGGTIGHPGGQQKKFLPFGHGRDTAAFNGTGLQNKSFQDRDK